MQALTGHDVERSLVERVGAGDQAAFAALFDLHVQRVYGHCARQVESLDDAEDLTAVVFLEAWRRRRDIRVVQGSAIAWLLMTATNVCRNHRRAKRRYRAALARLTPPEATPDPADAVVEDLAFADRGRAAAAALARLGSTDRQVLSLCLIAGLSYAEVGELLDISHAAVRSRLMRARRQVRAELEQAGITTAQDPDGLGETQ